MPIFSRSEIHHRRAALAESMRREGIFSAFVWTQDNIYYLSGMPVIDRWGRPEAAIIGQDGRCSLIVPAGELLNAETNASVDEVLFYGDSTQVGASVLELALEILRRLGSDGQRIAIERTHLPYDISVQLLQTLRSPEPAELERIVAPIRIIKSAEELELLRLGGEVAKDGMQAFFANLLEGSSEAELVAAAEAGMYRSAGPRLGDLPFCCFAYCNSGPHTLAPHLRPTGRKAQKGDVVGLNVFPVVAGYLMELERTVIVGRPTPEQLHVLDTVGRAFSVGKAAVSNGARACDVYQATYAVRATNGYGAYTRGGAGHSHGVMIGSGGREELGEIRSYNVEQLRKGMVVSIEPGIYIPGMGGFRHSDVVLVTDQGGEVLTEFDAPVYVS